MALEVSIEPKHEYLLVNVAGKYEMEDAIDRFPEVLAACRYFNLNKVLLDFRTLQGEQYMVQEIMYAMGIGEIYQQHLKSGGNPLKIAYVGSPKFFKSQIPGLEMSKMYGMNVYPTIDLNEAKEWLSS